MAYGFWYNNRTKNMVVVHEDGGHYNTAETLGYSYPGDTWDVENTYDRCYQWMFERGWLRGTRVGLQLCIEYSGHVSKQAAIDLAWMFAEKTKSVMPRFLTVDDGVRTRDYNLDEDEQMTAKDMIDAVLSGADPDDLVEGAIGDFLTKHGSTAAKHLGTAARAVGGAAKKVGGWAAKNPIKTGAAVAGGIIAAKKLSKVRPGSFARHPIKTGIGVAAGVAAVKHFSGK